jgi:hypothetical protein
MSIKCRLTRFDQKTCIFIVFVSQYTYIVVKYKIHLYSLQNRPEKLAKGSLFCLFLKLAQINLIFTDNVRILYIYLISQYLLQIGWYAIYLFFLLQNSKKKDRNKRHSSPFIDVVKGVFFVVHITLVPVSYLSAPSAVHSYRVPGKFIRRLKSLFIGWKVYSSSTNKAKIKHCRINTIYVHCR